jgi:acetolactate synthase-1/2/3 large subunit
MDHLRSRLPEDAIVTNGAGNFSVWVHRFYRHARYRTQLGPTSGAMGYGVPAAVAAKAVHPERVVVCFCGDGDFLMTGQELATAVQYGLAIVVIVVNNGMYGTIRMHQERHYPGRVIGSDLVNPDFAAYARAFGAHGELVEVTEQFAPAFERALSSGRPAVIELRIDPQAITPNTTLDALRRQAQAAT